MLFFVVVTTLALLHCVDTLMCQTGYEITRSSNPMIQTSSSKSKVTCDSTYGSDPSCLRVDATVQGELFEKLAQ